MSEKGKKEKAKASANGLLNLSWTTIKKQLWTEDFKRQSPKGNQPFRKEVAKSYARSIRTNFHGSIV